MNELSSIHVAKIEEQGPCKNHCAFTISFHNIQLDTTVTYSLGGDTTIGIDRSTSYSIDKFIN